MDNREYWANRFRALEESTYEHSKSWIKNAEKAFDKALVAVKNKVSYFYSYFGDLTGVSYAEAKRTLNKGELKEFKITVDEYIRLGKSLDDNFNPTILKQLQMASTRVRVSRWEAIKYFILGETSKLHAEQQVSFYENLGEAYENRYYQTCFELRSIGTSFSRLNKKQIKVALNKPWSDVHFSDRIWSNQNKLQTALTKAIQQGVILGQGYTTIISGLTKDMKTAASNCARLISTEMAAVSSMAQQDTFKDLNVEQYEIVATLDDRTSKICQRLDGKVFDMKDFAPGETAPPFHPNCRTVTAPYFKDMKPTKRVARRGGDGRSEYVDNMTYNEWAKKNNIKPIYGLWEPA